MSRDKERNDRWLRRLVLILCAYCVIGLLIEAAVPHLLPETAFTTYVGGAARSGVFVIWLYLVLRIVGIVRGIYGPDSDRYLTLTPLRLIFLQVAAAYLLAAFCFAVLYLFIMRRDTSAFSVDLDLANAIYFSIVTMTTTGYGDISPKSGWAKTAVCVQILFGVFYNVLFFSIFAGLAGRKRVG
ncbi:potassium channel family protein [Bradyrhizobium sp. LB11.1]|uniref:potassium channel family protein n=1 Tax=Bradyrhizobium sp. LB11.1 TaxID=3156326 RepID=UPI00339981EC